MIRRSTLLLTLLVTSYLLLVTNCNAQSAGYIRVAVLQDVPSLNLKVLGRYEIIDSVTQKALSGGYNLKTTVTAYKNEILLGKITSNTPKLFIKTNEAGIILINGRRFRGNIELIKKENARLMAVNYIGLEDYIKGILYHEASHYWPMEALQAQAIVSRSYAVYQMHENKLKDYDVTSDIYSQVYGGKASERARTNNAVDATSGEVIAYKNKVVPAYFHAVCGGHTEDASLLWDIDLPPLKGVSCNFCKDSPHFNWHYVLTLEEIEQKLLDAGLKISGIKHIAILGKDTSGRITDLNIVSGKKDFKISAKDFRNIIGPNIIKSTNFSVNVIKHDAVFEGFGWGHGVGLCQWGAYFMAKQGYTTEQILKYYYPGIDVKTIGF
jgi:stage II sporulation protein D